MKLTQKQFDYFFSRSGLNKSSQAILKLMFVEGLSPTEAASKLPKTSPSSASAKRKRFLAAITEHLADKGIKSQVVFYYDDSESRMLLEMLNRKVFERERDPI